MTTLEDRVLRMMRESEDRTAALIAASEKRIMDRFEKQDEKIDESADFRTVFMGATKILAWLVVVGAPVAGIYLAIHSGSGGHP